MPGFWEFPGGKIEGSESEVEAVRRELSEELGIDILEATLLDRSKNEYPDKGTFSVAYYVVRRWSGQIRAVDYRSLAWVRPEEIIDFAHLSGNLVLCRGIAEGKYGAHLSVPMPPSELG